jgi:HSP20 family protein
MEVNMMIPMIRNRGTIGNLVDVSRDLDRLMNSILTDAGNGGAVWPMPTEVVESAEELRFDIEVPGMRLEDIELTLENNVLTISGEKKFEQQEGRDESDYRLFERRYGRFQRSFTVPPTVRGDQCDARYENGVLTVRLPKAEEARPRRIRVQGGEGARQIEGHDEQQS